MKHLKLKVSGLVFVALMIVQGCRTDDPDSPHRDPSRPVSKVIVAKVIRGGGAEPDLYYLVAADGSAALVSVGIYTIAKTNEAMNLRWWE